MIRQLFFLCLFFIGALALSRSVPSACRERIAQSDDVRALFDAAGLNAFWNGNASRALEAATVKRLRSQSSDRLLKAILSLSQAPACDADPGVKRILPLLKAVYLDKLGAWDAQRSLDVPESLFRAFVTQKTDQKLLKERISELRAKKVPFADLPKAIYGTVISVHEVAVVGPSGVSLKGLKSEIEKLCGARAFCPFWDERVLFKVVLSESPGLAAYLPELSTLVLSKTLVEMPNLLEEVVLAHELTHVAERSHFVRTKERWMNSFERFSGWQKDRQGKWSVPKVVKATQAREDELTKLSQSSPFSLLPDPVYLPFTQNGRAYDGFVFAKSYRDSASRGDPSEDLADSVAAYAFAPFRYCFHKTEIAPQKWAWIAREIFPDKTATKLSCR